MNAQAAIKQNTLLRNGAYGMLYQIRHGKRRHMRKR